MANHVHSYICFREINDKAKATLQRLFEERLRTENDYKWFSDLFVGEMVNEEGGELTYEQSEKYSWTTGFIGPKWCYIEDYDVDCETPYIVTESAWSHPEEGLMRLLEILEKDDPNMITSITYDDEMPNFVGWSVYVGSAMEDGCEDDDEEIRDAIFYQHPHLKEHWDEENDEWQCDEDGELTEEASHAEDEYRDVMYEVINDMQDTGIENAIHWILEYRKEQEEASKQD
jgi:hypothetical protein